VIIAVLGRPDANRRAAAHNDERNQFLIPVCNSLLHFRFMGPLVRDHSCGRGREDLAVLSAAKKKHASFDFLLEH